MMRPTVKLVRTSASLHFPEMPMNLRFEHLFLFSRSSHFNSINVIVSDCVAVCVVYLANNFLVRQLYSFSVGGV